MHHSYSSLNPVLVRKSENLGSSDGDVLKMLLGQQSTGVLGVEVVQSFLLCVFFISSKFYIFYFLIVFRNMKFI